MQITPEQAEQLATQLEMQYHQLDLSPTKKGQNVSAVRLLDGIVDRIIIHASRLPSLTVDIMPQYFKQHMGHLEDLYKQAIKEQEEDPQKFKCAC